MWPRGGETTQGPDLHSSLLAPMPVCLVSLERSSNVMPIMANPPPMSSESRSSYKDYGVEAAASTRPYRGVLLPAPAGVVTSPSLVQQLEGLGARLKAMQPGAEPAPIEPSCVLPEAYTYDTFAQYAGEASRVVATGRLPFGSDSKKMAL